MKKMKKGDSKEVMGKRPPKMGGKGNVSASAKHTWRDRNTTKAGMGGRESAKQKRLKNVII